jgi:hypothetical protein
MGLVARHREYPDKVFLYLPERIENNTAVLKVVSKKNNVNLNESYEFVIPIEGIPKKFIGVVKEIKGNRIKVELREPASDKRKFNRFAIKKSIIPVGIVAENLNKPVTGILRDISLGGFKIKFSERDFNLLKNYIGGLSVIAIFRFLNEKDFHMKTDATPIRFDEKEKTVAFTFPFGSDSGNALRIYEKVIKVEKNNGG